ncbi:MAG: universal stress protein [Myxococcales bacterium]|nr:universal stress protein [Myxococcales bacterium]MCB9524447.1 universal stress protein [Myxococcales bacterium]
MSHSPSAILIPSDLTGETRHLLDYALSQPHQAGARIILLHVVHIGEHVWSMLAKAYDTKGLEEQLRELANGALAAYVADHPGDHPFKVEVQVHWGQPAEMVLSVADSEKVDEIVMGRHRPDSVKGFFLGSTADKVLRAAKVPVTVIPF